MKKILLDTTYILPIFGIDVAIPDLKEKLSLWSKQNNLYINSLSILEAKWKVLKLAKKVPSLLEFFSEGLFYLTHGSKFEIIPFYSYEVDYIATELHKFHKDYIDCSILSSAIINSEIFITEEKDNMVKLLRNLSPDLYIYRKSRYKLEILTFREAARKL